MPPKKKIEKSEAQIQNQMLARKRNRVEKKDKYYFSEVDPPEPEPTEDHVVLIDFDEMIDLDRETVNPFPQQQENQEKLRRVIRGE